MHSIDRSVNVWKWTPGNWDVLNFAEVFPSENEYGIPTISKSEHIPSQLIQWGSRPQLLTLAEYDNVAVHFFLDDYRFESLWKTPARNLDALEHIGRVLSPDFSLWLDMPIAMQIWNVYRNRWLGCFWQNQGITVIPTISWSQPHDFCYKGVEQGSTVAISTVGVMRDKSAKNLFRAGFEKMIDTLHPCNILCYGSLSQLEITSDVPIIEFPTRWQKQKPQTKGAS